MGTPLGPKYIPYTYMDPLGKEGQDQHRGWCAPQRVPSLGVGLGGLDLQAL